MTNEQVIAALVHLIGTEYTSSLKAEITEITGRQRIVGPNEASTMEYDLNRVHVVADGELKITGFTFG